MDNGSKNSFKILNTNDIRKQARDWNLAGDAGLLAHLEQFSEEVFNKTSEIQKYFNELVDNYEEVYTNVGNVTNQFLALQNCQFVENRVYDEETPTKEETYVKKVPDEAEQERILLKQYKEAVELGVKLLDTHFEEVQLPPNSDSEEEDDEPSAGNSLIWKPKNPYAGKKFPLLIGSNEWWADDNVGLKDFDEILDTEKMISESESDVESTQGVEKRMQSSSSSSLDNEKSIPAKPTFLESSSEDIFGLNRNDNFDKENDDFFVKEPSFAIKKPSRFSSQIFDKQDDEKSSTLENPANENQITGKTDNTIQNDVVEKNPQKINNAFTRELVAKLATVTKKPDDLATKGVEQNVPVNKPKEKQSHKDENLFDETDESRDLFVGKVKSMTVPTKDLFFDSENDDQLFSGSSNLLFEPGSIFESDSQLQTGYKINKDSSKTPVTSEKKEGIVPKKSLVSDLFDDINDDDVLFISKPVENQLKKESLLSGNKEISETSQSKLLNSEGLFDSLSNDFEDDLLSNTWNNEVKKKANSDLESDSMFRETTPISTPKRKDSKELFQDTSSDNALFQQKKTYKQMDNSDFSKQATDNKTSFLDEDENDLFSENSLFKEERKSKLLSALDDDDAFLFGGDNKPKDSVSISSSRSSLFDDVSASKSKLAFVFEKDKTNTIENDLFDVSGNSVFGDSAEKSDGKDLFSSKTSSKSKGTSLFDDFDDSDDLFGIAKDEGDVLNKKKEGHSDRSEDLLEDLSKNSKSMEQKESKVDSLNQIPAFSKQNSVDDLFADFDRKTEAAQETFEKSKVEKSEPKQSEEISKTIAENDDLFITKNTLASKISFLDTSEDDDLFKTPFAKEPSHIEEKSIQKESQHRTNLRETKSDIFRKSEMLTSDDDDDLFVQKGKSSTDIIKPKPPISLNLEKNEVSNADASVSSVKPKSVGKLNIPDNLKVKFESMAKNISSGDETKVKEEKKIDLDETNEPTHDLLKCPSKDRVKIQVKRRPQSRRARQEALRNSGINFDVSNEKQPSETSLVQKEFKEQSLFSSPVVSNPLSPSTDEEDYFNVPELDTNFEKEDQGIFDSDLFQTSKNDSKPNGGFLFNTAPVLSPLASTKEDGLFSSSESKLKAKIFDDDDDDDDGEASDHDLFKKATPSKTSGLFHITKKPLFVADDDDDDDEDDLFGENKPKPQKTTKPESEAINKNSENKSQKTKSQPFIDPLGLMSNDD